MELFARMETGRYGPRNEKVHECTRGHHRVPWAEFCDEAYGGWVAKNGEVVPRFLAGFEPWQAERRHDKMKCMTKCFLDHYSNIAMQKHLRDETPEPHEKQALKILSEMNRAQAAVDTARRVKAAKAEATRLENESEETLMGVRPKKRKPILQARDALYEKTKSPGPSEFDTCSHYHQKNMLTFPLVTSSVFAASMVDLMELPSSSGEEDLGDYHASLAKYAKKAKSSSKRTKSKTSRRYPSAAVAAAAASTVAAASSAAGGGRTSTGGLLPGDRQWSGDCDLEAEEAFFSRHHATATADEEERLAKSAVIGSKSIKYGPGQKNRTPRDTDHQDKVDGYFEDIKNEEGGIVSVMQKIAATIPAPAAAASASVESPTTKNLKLSDYLVALLKERREFLDAGLPIDDVDRQIQITQEKRCAFNAQGAGVNLGAAFNENEV